jgi:hypothetical protein
MAPEASLGRSIIGQFRISIQAEYPRRTFVVEYQPNPRRLDRAAHRSKVIRSRGPLPFFKFIDRAERHVRSPCELTL